MQTVEIPLLQPKMHHQEHILEFVVGRISIYEVECSVSCGSGQVG
jgi:hypothetical protein